MSQSCAQLKLSALKQETQLSVIQQQHLGELELERATVKEAYEDELRQLRTRCSELQTDLSKLASQLHEKDSRMQSMSDHVAKLSAEVQSLRTAASAMQQQQQSYQASSSASLPSYQKPEHGPPMQFSTMAAAVTGGAPALRPAAATKPQPFDMDTPTVPDADVVPVMQAMMDGVRCVFRCVCRAEPSLLLAFHSARPPCRNPPKPSFVRTRLAAFQASSQKSHGGDKILAELLSPASAITPQHSTTGAASTLTSPVPVRLDDTMTPMSTQSIEDMVASALSGGRLNDTTTSSWGAPDDSTAAVNHSLADRSLFEQANVRQSTSLVALLCLCACCDTAPSAVLRSKR